MPISSGLRRGFPEGITPPVASPEKPDLSRLRAPAQLLFRYFVHVRPIVERETALWRRQAASIPDPELRRQAIASLRLKKFHCDGGAFYAVQVPERAPVLVPLIVAYQTICDYLDNLCDRGGSRDGRNFRQLHLALKDALTPGSGIRNYYRYHPQDKDGGYLASLVYRCQQCLSRLTYYPMVQSRALELASLYSDLQVYKHVEVELREAELWSWWLQHRGMNPGLYWQEFAAACGSTLEMFALFCVSASLAMPDALKVGLLSKAHFPWISSLHILLDYLIDTEEDRLGGDLNLVSYYSSASQVVERLRFIAATARTKAEAAPEPLFHRIVINGLVGFYLSDRKVNGRQPEVRFVADALLNGADGFARFVHRFSPFLFPRPSN